MIAVLQERPHLYAGGVPGFPSSSLWSHCGGAQGQDVLIPHLPVTPKQRKGWHCNPLRGSEIPETGRRCAVCLAFLDRRRVTAPGRIGMCSCKRHRGQCSKHHVQHFNRSCSEPAESARTRPNPVRKTAPQVGSQRKATTGSGRLLSRAFGKLAGQPQQSQLIWNTADPVKRY